MAQSSKYSPSKYAAGKNTTNKNNVGKNLPAKNSAPKASVAKAQVKSQYAKSLEAEKMKKAQIIDHEPLDKQKNTPSAKPEPTDFPTNPPASPASTASMQQSTTSDTSKTTLDNAMPSQSAAKSPSSPPPKLPTGKTPIASAPPPDAKSMRKCIKRSFCLVISGIIGGIIALCLAAILQYFAIIPQFAQNNNAALQANIAENSNKIAQLSAALAELQNNPTPTNIAENQALEVSTQWQETIAILQQDIATLNQRFATLNVQPSDIQATTNTMPDEVLQKIAALQQNLANLQNLSANIQQLTAQNNALNDKNAQNSQAITALKTNIANIEKQIQNPIAGKEIATIMAADALKAAVDRGGSYANELKLLQDIAPNIGDLTNLQKTANIGLPNQAKLSQDFASVADKIAASENYADENAGFGNQIWSKAKGFVTSRPTGDVEGNNPAAIAARMEVAIGKGDYQKALSEWQNLPQNAKNVSSDFIATLTAKRDIDALLANIIAISLKANDNQNAASRTEQGLK